MSDLVRMRQCDPLLRSRVRRCHDWSWRELRGETGAVFSTCERYRYALWRIWNPQLPTLIFVGLNPSTADERTEDPTIRRILSFAARDGAGALLMLNLFAWRATNPKELYSVEDPVGPVYRPVVERWLAQVRHAKLVVGWGAHGALRRRPDVQHRSGAVFLGARRPYCFGLTSNGQPKHPLYLADDTPLVLLSDARRAWRNSTRVRLLRVLGTRLEVMS